MPHNLYLHSALVKSREIDRYQYLPVDPHMGTYIGDPETEGSTSLEKVRFNNRVADLVLLRTDPDPKDHNFKNRFRIRLALI